MSKRKKRKLRRQYITIIGSVILIVGAVMAYGLYSKIYGPNIHLKEKETAHIYIPTGSTEKDVLRILDTSNVIQDMSDFKWLAEKKNYQNHIHPGRYQIKNGMSNNALINLLRSGQQDPVELTFNNIRRKRALAGVVSKQIEADSSDIIRLLNDGEYLQQYDVTPQTVPALFIPNTYEFYWNTPAPKFIERMHREYKRFWNEERKNKAEKIGLSPIEVSTLASITEEETNKKEEMPTIAGVYINRLEKGMRLQADPTIKFAIGDFSVNRILDKYLEHDSPYNTYKYAGLPPGPISFPSIAAIEAVLNYENHDYLYFSAKPDFSGYHNFSKTHYQHIQKARKYQEALNEKKIMK
ncbi:MAG: endolytic transglycosylase MltG [Bacteroidales bacterium]|nr:endolytic transglycosylase MltG [Bacteroidales bacterium]